MEKKARFCNTTWDPWTDEMKTECVKTIASYSAHKSTKDSFEKKWTSVLRAMKLNPMFAAELLDLKWTTLEVRWKNFSKAIRDRHQLDCDSGNSSDRPEGPLPEYERLTLNLIKDREDSEAAATAISVAKSEESRRMATMESEIAMANWSTMHLNSTLSQKLPATPDSDLTKSSLSKRSRSRSSSECDTTPSHSSAADFVTALAPLLRSSNNNSDDPATTSAESMLSMKAKKQEMLEKRILFYDHQLTRETDSAKKEALIAKREELTAKLDALFEDF